MVFFTILRTESGTDCGLSHFDSPYIDSLLGSALAIWLLESGTVIGASTLVFGLWAMQVGWGFRLAHSLPPKVQAHYGWGNFWCSFPRWSSMSCLPKSRTSHIGRQWGLAVRSLHGRPRIRVVDQMKEKQMFPWLKTLVVHVLGRRAVSLYLMHKPLTYSVRHSSDAGFSSYTRSF